MRRRANASFVKIVRRRIRARRARLEARALNRRAPGRANVPKRLHNVFALKIWEVRQDFVGAPSGADLADHHAHGHAQAADARLATHDAWALGDSVEWLHRSRPLRR